MLLLPIIKESPRWLATKHKEDQAVKNLAWLRKLPVDDPRLIAEFAEIQAAIREEEEATQGASWREIFIKGNRIRFVMAFVSFFYTPLLTIRLPCLLACADESRSSSLSNNGQDRVSIPFKHIC